MNKLLIEIRPLLEYPQQIVITHHYNADADALGASLGLYHFLTLKGHKCTVISPNSMPDFLQWMPAAYKVLKFDEQKQEVIKAIEKCQLIFCLDFNQFSRTKDLAPYLEKSKAKKILIDHHLNPAQTFDFGISRPSKSSTCEMIFDLINENGDNALINLDIAQCLYSGVMTDTGSFKFPSTTASVHLMVADLMQKGLHPTPIHQAILDNYQENRLRFLGYVLAEKMLLFPEFNSAVIAISKEELNKYKINTGDTEGIVNYPLSIQNIIFSTFISERDHEMRMSFRSKGDFNVNIFARNYFNGGGHHNASGGRSDVSLAETLKNFKQALEDNKKQLKQCYLDLQ
ncbi:MAG TPA: bifunctional oligoribonuclease/PAP phosphatase NrnA [Chitinophagaceae bacterium]|nr:bifunctional oligoribonuclease/PAP phosphatase NrnA [Chitinophagaceae bacterium]